MSRAVEGDSAARDGNRSETAKGKSCKGTLYYSSILKSEGRNPRCVGLTSSLPRVTSLTAGESEAEASKEGRSLTDFKYTCVGYSIYSDDKEASNGGRKPGAQLPVCFGIELLVDKRPVDGSAPARAHGSEGWNLPSYVSSFPESYKGPTSLMLEPRGIGVARDVIFVSVLLLLLTESSIESDGGEFPLPRPNRPSPPTNDEFLTRLARNAGVVASGVIRNAHRIGKHIKNHIGDALYPRRPR